MASERYIQKRKKRAQLLLQKLKKLFPDARMVLRYSNNWELLVAVILSAQCTDKMVNKVTEKLFKKYRKKKRRIVWARKKKNEKKTPGRGVFTEKKKNTYGKAGG